jgi:membrane associated rhomboid family serine protease
MDAPAADSDVPIWAREDAFPKSPDDGWGWVDHKGARHSCDSVAALLETIRKDLSATVTLVWTPEHPRMVLPEELPEAAEAVMVARKRRAFEDLDESRRRLWILGGGAAMLAFYLFYQGWVRTPPMAGAWDRLLLSAGAVMRSVSMGIVLLVFLIFAFIPWYQARKRWLELGKWTSADLPETIAVLRFETWLAAQRAPATRIFLGLVGMVWLAQLASPDDIAAAGLVKSRYFAGEWWRLCTAPFLHGNWVHLLMNCAALAYLGKRLEVFARWQHLPLVFVFAAWVGGEASARLVLAPTVGASGGLMGWLGFLLVFETLHHQLVPRSARRRLLAGVLLTGLIGLVGYRFIDNAAHAGGLIAGMLYAWIVFPKSASPHRPRSTATDWIAGILALATASASALLAVVKIIG